MAIVFHILTRTTHHCTVLAIFIYISHNFFGMARCSAILFTIHSFAASPFYSISLSSFDFFIILLLLLFCYTWTFNSSSLTCRRSPHTYSDMSIYLSIKFYILVLFTENIHTPAHLGWDIHCVEQHFELTLCGRYLICFHSYSNISLKYSWICTHQPDQPFVRLFLPQSHRFPIQICERSKRQ